MAITTYTELKAAVASWLHRSDMTATIVDCVTLCESELQDRLLLKNMEVEDTLTLTLNQNYVALPSGFISPIALWLVISSERILLDPATPEELQYASNSSIPRYWAIDGANIRFDCPANSAYTAYLRCIKQTSVVSGTNYLLTKRPDVYLFGTLKQCAIFTKQDNDLARYSGLFEQAIAGLKASESRNRAIAPLRTDIHLPRRSGNILRGD